MDCTVSTTLTQQLLLCKKITVYNICPFSDTFMDAVFLQGALCCTAAEGTKAFQHQFTLLKKSVYKATLNGLDS